MAGEALSQERTFGTLILGGYVHLLTEPVQLIQLGPSPSMASYPFGHQQCLRVAGPRNELHKLIQKLLDVSPL